MLVPLGPNPTPIEFKGSFLMDFSVCRIRPLVPGGEGNNSLRIKQIHFIQYDMI